VYEKPHNVTKGSDASNSHYGRKTVKMDSRICNYFIFSTLFQTVDVIYVDIRLL